MKKDLNKWTTVDLRQLWLQEFKKHNKKEYEVYGFIGNENKKLKEALDLLGPYGAAIAVLRAVRSGVKSINWLDINQYGPTTNKVVIEYHIMAKSPPAYIKKAWARYKILDTKWLEDARDVKEKQELEAQIMEWLDLG